MPRTAKLKVFRVPAGFHDAYVAAPSQKAALAAWGADADLFARGIAERVDDPELAREPLANPGTVIRRLRGSAAEQIAALPPDRARTPKAEQHPEPRAEHAELAGSPRARPPRSPSPPRPPRPSRAELDAAEHAMARLRQQQAAEREELARRREALDRAARALRTRHANELAQAAQAFDKAEADYARAIKAWRR